MPYRSKRPTTRRRFPKRRKFVRRRRAPIARTLGGTVGLFGSPTVRRTLKYVENITLSSTAGAIVTQIFTANGLYDPNITGGGHQPIWFDQIMPYFNHYCVTGSKINIAFTQRGSSISADASVVVGVALRPSVTTASSFQLYMENGQQRYKVLSTDPASRATLSMGMNTRKYFGKKYTVDNYDLKGTIGSNPVEEVFYQLYADPLTGADSPNVNALVTITYYAVFSEPNPAASS